MPDQGYDQEAPGECGATRLKAASAMPAGSDVVDVGGENQDRSL